MNDLAVAIYDNDTDIKFDLSVEVKVSDWFANELVNDINLAKLSFKKPGYKIVGYTKAIYDKKSLTYTFKVLFLKDGDANFDKSISY